MLVALNGHDVATVIDIESLVIHRIRRATDRTRVTFDEAVRPGRSNGHRRIVRRARNEDREAPLMRLIETFGRIMARAR